MRLIKLKWRPPRSALLPVWWCCFTLSLSPLKIAKQPIDYYKFLLGFANPALVTLICLLILGDALGRTGALDRLTGIIIGLSSGYRMLALLLIFLSVLAISGFLNNIPVVVIFIPIIKNLCRKYRMRPGQHMMSLSYISILGGMTTLIGSSTNLLVSSALIGFGYAGFSFFSFTLPGLMMVAAGLFYVIFIMPFIMRYLGDQTIPHEHDSKNVFFTQFLVGPESKLIGKTANQEGEFADLPKGVELQFIKRSQRVYRSPFKGVAIEEKDLLVLALTQEDFDKINDSQSLEVFSNLVKAGIHSQHGVLTANHVQQMGRVEAVVLPHSSLVNRTISASRFLSRYNCVVLGIKRQKERIEQAIEQVKLEGGDVLILQGNKDDFQTLKRSRNMILMQDSLSDVGQTLFFKRTFAIFAISVLFAALGIVPIMITTLLGVLALLLFSVISVPNMLGAIDSRIIVVISASLALGLAMEVTGGAAVLAELIIDILWNSSPPFVLSMFFLITAILSNILSTKATAILFTPIAINVADVLGVDYFAFAVAVVFASNCSFASPIGYQTNLMVMGPGGYTFRDFIKVGLPLLFVCWGMFTFLSYNWFLTN